MEQITWNSPSSSIHCSQCQVNTLSDLCFFTSYKSGVEHFFQRELRKIRASSYLGDAFLLLKSNATSLTVERVICRHPYSIGRICASSYSSFPFYPAPVDPPYQQSSFFFSTARELTTRILSEWEVRKREGGKLDHSTANEKKVRGGKEERRGAGLPEPSGN